MLLHGLLIGAGDIGVTELNANLMVVRDVGRNIGLCVCQAASACQSLPHICGLHQFCELIRQRSGKLNQPVQPLFLLLIQHSFALFEHCHDFILLEGGVIASNTALVIDVLAVLVKKQLFRPIHIPRPVITVSFNTIL